MNPANAINTTMTPQKIIDFSMLITFSLPL